MKELNRTDRLTIATILVAVVLIIGFMTLKKPDLQFSHPITESLFLVTASTDPVSYDEVARKAEMNDAEHYIVDLRSPDNFQKSHIVNAVNIPVQDLLDPEYLDLFDQLEKESVTVILYADDPLQANGAWMLLKQMGYDHVKAMSSGYDVKGSHLSDRDSIDVTALNPLDKPEFDYRSVLDQLTGPLSSGQNTRVSPVPVQVIKRDKKSRTEGGC